MEKEREMLNVYCQILKGGFWAAAKQPTHLSKVNQVFQGPEETPETFLERLREVYKPYTPLDPDSVENQSAVSLAFVNQSTPDIRCKLQKLEDFKSKRLAELIAVAEIVFNNRKIPVDRQEHGAHRVLPAVSCSPQIRRQALTLGDSVGKGKGLMQGLHNRPVCKKTNVSTEKIKALNDRAQK